MNLPNLIVELNTLTKLKPEMMLAAANQLLTSYQVDLEPNEYLALQRSLKAFGVPFEGDQEIGLSNAPPSSQHYFGELFKTDLYGVAYEIAALAYLFEKNGIIEEHATKLSVMFKDHKTMLDYLAKYAQSAQLSQSPVHDACLFSLPDFSETGFKDEKEGCHFAIWKDLANQKERMLDRDFKKMLPFAWKIEQEVRKGLQEAKQTKFKRDNSAINQKKEDVRNKLKRFNDLERLKSDLNNEQEEEYDLLSKEISIARQELAVLLKGKFLKDMSTDEIRAFFEVYRCQQDPSYQIFLDNGIPPKYYEVFESLDRQQDEQQIPFRIIDGASINYPGCYLKSVNVLDKAEAARAACFGKMTDCCQSLSGEAGQPCVIHGLTSPHGGFYVVCRGDVNNPQVSDPVLGMTWAWRSLSNAIVFDSIEISKDERDEEDQNRVNSFFTKLARDLVQEGHTHKVVCGSTSGISPSVGHSYVVNPLEKSIDYKGYCDSSAQRVIVDTSSPFYLYGSDHKSTEETIQFIQDTMQNPSPLHGSEVFSRMINFAIMEKKTALGAEINDIATKAGRKDELERFEKNVFHFYYENNHFASMIKESFINGELSPNLRTKTGLTPLIIAIMTNDKELVESLLDRNADIDAGDLNGNTPLIYALSQKNHNLATLLLNRGARVDIANNAGQSPLHVAAWTDDKEMIELLLSKNADIEDYDTHWRTPLMTACVLGKKMAIESLVSAGANVNARDYDGRTPLHLLTISGNTECLEPLLKNGADINAMDDDSLTPTLLAIIEHQNEMMSKLIELGADINMALTNDSKSNAALEYAFANKNMQAVFSLVKLLKIDSLLLHKAVLYEFSELFAISDLSGWNNEINSKDVNGKTPLHIASKVEDLNIFDKILGMNPDVNLKDNQGRTALHILLHENPHSYLTKLEKLLNVQKLDINLQDAEGKTPLLVAIESFDLKACRLLIDKGASVQIPDKMGYAPLMTAIVQRRMDIAELLIQNGAKLDVTDSYGRTLMDIALGLDYEQIVLMLLDKGFDINCQDGSGRTPLHRALISNNTYLVNELIIRGAKLDIQDNQGNTVLHYAIMKGHLFTCVQRLIASGAPVNVQNNEGKTALHINTDLRLIRLLIESGADVNLLDKNGYTPLMILEKMRDRTLISAFKKYSYQAKKENQDENAVNRPKAK